MRWVFVALAVIAALVAIVVVGGLLLPVGHVASVRGFVAAPPESVYMAIADVAGGPAWRSDLDEVRVLSSGGEPLRWLEQGRYGAIRYVREEERPHERIVSRIDGTEQGFGGRWTWRLEPEGAGTRVTVTEDGEVYNPVFRFLSRFVFGHYGTMEGYLRDLGRRFGSEVAPERLEA